MENHPILKYLIPKNKWERLATKISLFVLVIVGALVLYTRDVVNQIDYFTDLNEVAYRDVHRKFRRSFGPSVPKYDWMVQVCGLNGRQIKARNIPADIDVVAFDILKQDRFFDAKLPGYFLTLYGRGPLPNTSRMTFDGKRVSTNYIPWSKPNRIQIDGSFDAPPIRKNMLLGRTNPIKYTKMRLYRTVTFEQLDKFLDQDLVFARVCFEQHIGATVIQMPERLKPSSNPERYKDFGASNLVEQKSGSI